MLHVETGDNKSSSDENCRPTGNGLSLAIGRLSLRKNITGTDKKSRICYA